ncbi:MAG: hypothetical protein ACOCSR_05730, partial [Wenzhouxiangella sp.]
VLRARLARESLAGAGDWNQLINELERHGDAALLLDALRAAGLDALDSGRTERALELARRALRPPVAIDTWSGNWQLHWIVARAGSPGNADPDALKRARDELTRVLSAMPDEWHADYRRHHLPAELADVEVEIN